MAPTRTIDIQDFMNDHKLSSYQVRIMAVCFLIVAIDGFDTAAIGFIAPALRTEWGMTAAQLAPLFGAGLFGLMVGAFVFGPLADRIGRKYSLILTVLFFGATSLAPDPSGEIAVSPLDSMLDEPIDLLKIDVEGMEMSVLAGAVGVIARWRPLIFVEVANRNTADFSAWLRNAGYRVALAFTDKGHANFLVAPEGTS